MDNVLVVGDWRNSLDEGELQLITEVEEMREKGYRLLPYRSTVSRLMDLLDGYDYITSTFLQEEKPPAEVPVAKAKKAK